MISESPNACEIRCGNYRIVIDLPRPEDAFNIRSGRVEPLLVGGALAYFQIEDGVPMWSTTSSSQLPSADLIEIVTATEKWFHSTEHRVVAERVLQARIAWLKAELQKRAAEIDSRVSSVLAKFDALKALYEKQRTEGISSAAFHDQSIGAITGWRWCNRPSSVAPNGHLWHVSYNSALKLHELPLPKSAEGIVNYVCLGCANFFAEGGK